MARIVKALIGQSNSAAIWFQRWITNPNKRGFLCRGMSLNCHFKTCCVFFLPWLDKSDCGYTVGLLSHEYLSLSSCFRVKKNTKMESKSKTQRMVILDCSRQPGNKPLKTFQDASIDKSTSRLVELKALTNVFLGTKLWLTSHIILSSTLLKYHRCFLWMYIDGVNSERKSRTNISSETRGLKMGAARHR